MDTYIRTYMDEEGYVPVSLVCTYQNVSCYGCSYYDILNKLKEVAIKSKYYEMDTENDLLRLKDDWKKVKIFLVHTKTKRQLILLDLFLVLIP